METEAHKSSPLYENFDAALMFTEMSLLKTKFNKFEEELEKNAKEFTETE